MMNLISKLMIFITILLSFTASHAQVKNLKTEHVKIFGNCGMCKNSIEKAGNVKKVSKVDWNQETMMATLSYDTMKTNREDILKRIALIGYDSEVFRAPDIVYARLHGCCQYERAPQLAKKLEVMKLDSIDANKGGDRQINEAKNGLSPLNLLVDHYFSLKDALIKSDSKNAAEQANEFIASIDLIKYEKLNTAEQDAWVKVKHILNEDAMHISSSLKIEQQRNYFISFSKNMYVLIKATKLETTIYVQHCPMANEGKGAYWLSKESIIKNPYFGSQMLNCGKTVETIK